MQVENQQFLQIISRKQLQNNDIDENTNSSIVVADSNSEQTYSVVEEMLAKNTDATIYSIADEVAQKNYASGESVNIIAKLDSSYIKEFGHVDHIETTTQTAQSEDIIGKISSDIIQETKFAVTIEDFSPSQIANIKQIIYDLHNKGGGSTDPVEPGDDDDGEEDVPKPSFIDEFDDVESMFDWLHEQDPSISKETGITRAQLIQFTQNDDWEDANSDFFGAINRIFDVLNKDGDEYLTVDEIKALIGDEIGTSTSAYLSKVESYAAELDSYYSTLSDQGKLEFAIEKTREYLEAAGLTAQLEALERLLAGTDTHNAVHVGQIAFGEFVSENGVTTLGAYNSMGFQFTYNGMNYTVYLSDADTETYDGGLTLNIDYYRDRSWYELVDTLVHELTHATAYQYTHFTEEGYVTSIDQSLIDKMYNAGALTADEYSYYSANINQLIQDAVVDGVYDPNAFSEELQRFYYLTYTLWGEYSAYQTDADYVDSVAGDVFERGESTTAVNGPDEKTTIENHIKNLYNQDGYVEAEPDWKWWTYA